MENAVHESTGALALVLIAVLLMVPPAGLFVRARRRRGTKFVKNHVSVRTSPGFRPPVDTRPVHGPEHDHMLAVTPIEDSRSTTVEEVYS